MWWHMYVATQRDTQFVRSSTELNYRRKFLTRFQFQFFNIILKLFSGKGLGRKMKCLTQTYNNELMLESISKLLMEIFKFGRKLQFKYFLVTVP